MQNEKNNDTSTLIQINWALQTHSGKPFIYAPYDFLSFSILYGLKCQHVQSDHILIKSGCENNRKLVASLSRPQRCWQLCSFLFSSMTFQEYQILHSYFQETPFVQPVIMMSVYISKFQSLILKILTCINTLKKIGFCAWGLDHIKRTKYKHTGFNSNSDLFLKTIQFVFVLIKSPEHVCSIDGGL